VIFSSGAAYKKTTFSNSEKNGLMKKAKTTEKAKTKDMTFL